MGGTRRGFLDRPSLSQTSSCTRTWRWRSGTSVWPQWSPAGAARISLSSSLAPSCGWWVKELAKWLIYEPLITYFFFLVCNKYGVEIKNVIFCFWMWRNGTAWCHFRILNIHVQFLMCFFFFLLIHFTLQKVLLRPRLYTGWKGINKVESSHMKLPVTCPSTYC